MLAIFWRLLTYLYQVWKSGSTTQNCNLASIVRAFEAKSILCRLPELRSLTLMEPIRHKNTVTLIEQPLHLSNPCSLVFQGPTSLRNGSIWPSDSYRIFTHSQYPTAATLEQRATWRPRPGSFTWSKITVQTFLDVCSHLCSAEGSSCIGMLSSLAENYLRTLGASVLTSAYSMSKVAILARLLSLLKNVYICRSLRIWEASPRVLDLVSTELQSLELKLKRGARGNAGPVIEKIGSLMFLTRLELHDFEPGILNLRPLHGLHLQDLAFQHCQGLEQKLFLPGALFSLTSPRIRESHERQQQTQGQDKLIQELADCSQIILGLPRLQELSGYSPLFSLGIAHELQSWQVTAYSKGWKAIMTWTCTISYLD